MKWLSFPLFLFLTLSTARIRAQVNLPVPLPAPEEVEAMKPDDTMEPGEERDIREVLYEGMVLVQDRKFEEAIPKLERVIQKDPTLLGAWETLGWAYWLTDRQDKAEELWLQLVDIAPDEPMGYRLLGQVATREADFDRALAMYNRSLELNPAQFEVRVSRAQVLLWAGREDEAIAEFRQLLKEDPERVDIEIDLAWSLFGDEQYEDSLVHWNRIVEFFPDQADFLLARANVHLLMGMLDEAREDALTALEAEPENIDAIKILTALAARSDQPRETVERMEELLDLAETDKTRVQVAQDIAIFKLAIRNQNPDVFTMEEVVEAGKRAWELDLENVTTALFYGESLVLDKQYREAQDVFDYVLDELNPNNERARYGKFESFMGRARYDDAEQQLRENLRNFNKENPYRHVYWARLYFAKGDFPQALLSLERLEYEGATGSVFTLLYHGISPSEFSDLPSERQLREQLMALKRDGFKFITPSQLELYFENTQPPPLVDDRPWLNQTVEWVKYAWTGNRKDGPPSLKDYSPAKVVMVTFDDGLRNSFRAGTRVGDELGVPLTMFLAVGDVQSKLKRAVANFQEIREAVDTGVWEIQSKLWDASELMPLDEEGDREGLPLVNRTWKPERGRLETLREYQARLKREFRDSKQVLGREFNLGEDEINSVAYPYGDIGQERSTNVELFNVTQVIQNEAEISYTYGFMESKFGYTMKPDNPMLHKRFRPGRFDSGRDVLRQAYLQHPVFLARRMRVEMAALSGQLHMAEDNIELLRRDGYPEEDLAELREYVQRHLARLVPLPESVDDEAEGLEGQEEKWIDLSSPLIGVDAATTRANVVIETREFGAFLGFNFNPRTAIKLRAAIGDIRQTLTTNTFVEVEDTTTTTSNSTVTTIENGVATNTQEVRTDTVTNTIQSNVVERFRFDAEYAKVDLDVSHVHRSGSFTIFNLGVYQLDTDGNLDFDEEAVSEQAITYGLEHQWRPRPALDFSALYQHGVVPSARQLITYDQVAVRPFWRIGDGWHLNAIGSFSYYEDRNSLIRAEMENFWRLSRELDIWMGLHSSLNTTDLDSNLYWSPFMEQRHYLVFRMRRSYPDYFGMFKINLGYTREKARPAELAEFEVARANAEAGGYSAGSGPDEGWNPLVGFSAIANRKWDNGVEISVEFTVNNTQEYTEHAVMGMLMWKF